MELVAKARAFAARKHASQTRKYTGEPYVCHLEAVARVLQAHGIDQPVILSAAYLHDTVEDTDTTIQELIAEFGDPIAELVYWLTDAEKGNRDSRKLMSAWRLARAPWDAKLIKLADITDNAGSITDHDPNFGPVYIAEKHVILERMAAIE